MTPHNKTDPAIRELAIRLYRDEKKTMPEVATELGLGLATIGRWLHSVGESRGYSKAFALAFSKGRKKTGRGRSWPWQSSKNGNWFFADSRWELVRMSQLDQNPDVLSWRKNAKTVPYSDENGKQRHYTPDFEIQYSDGLVVEEIKPQSLMGLKSNEIKKSAAIDFFSKLGIGYKIITENDIGLENIRQFKACGLMTPTEIERADIKRRYARDWARRKSGGVGHRFRASQKLKREAAAKAASDGIGVKAAARVFNISDVAIYNELRRQARTNNILLHVD